jgi:hypothetical protein
LRQEHGIDPRVGKSAATRMRAIGEEILKQKVTHH